MLGTANSSVPVVGYFDANGPEEMAVFTIVNGQGVWSIASAISPRTVTFGQTGDIPVPGNYDGLGYDRDCCLPAQHRPVLGTRAERDYRNAEPRSRWLSRSEAVSSPFLALTTTMLISPTISRSEPKRLYTIPSPVCSRF